jgi:hypothetical protein
MIDPARITDFNRSAADLEDFLLFAVAVAGHKAIQTVESLRDFYRYGHRTAIESPFAYVRRLDSSGTLDAALRVAKFGNFGKNARAYRALAGDPALDLRVVDFAGLMGYHGVGPKTAAFYLAHTRGERIAVLDTHVLAELRALGVPTPRQTPQRLATYMELSHIYLMLMAEQGRDPVQADLAIWMRRSGYGVS